MGTLDDFEYQSRSKEALKARTSWVEDNALKGSYVYVDYDGTKKMEERFRQHDPISGAKLPDGYVYDMILGKVVEDPNRKKTTEEDFPQADKVEVKVEYEDVKDQLAEEIIDQISEETFVINAEDLDYSKIARTAQDALLGSNTEGEEGYIDENRILKEYWTGELEYKYRDDGTILLLKDGVPMGFISVDALTESYAEKRIPEIEEQMRNAAAQEAQNAELFGGPEYDNLAADGTELPPGYRHNKESGEVTFYLQGYYENTRLDTDAGWFYDPITQKVININELYKEYNGESGQYTAAYKYDITTGKAEIIPDMVYDDISNKVVYRYNTEAPGNYAEANPTPTVLPPGKIYDRLTGEIIDVQLPPTGVPNEFYDPTNPSVIIHINEDGTVSHAAIAPRDGTNFSGVVGADIIYLPNNSYVVDPGIDSNFNTTTVVNGVVTSGGVRFELREDGYYHKIVTKFSDHQEYDEGTFTAEDIAEMYIEV